MATYYINPNASSGGDGTTIALTGDHRAFSNWPTVADNHTYLQAAGTTTAPSASIQLQSGNVFGCYDTTTGLQVTDGSQTAAINCAAVTSHGIDSLGVYSGNNVIGLEIYGVTGSGKHGIYLMADSGCSVKYCKVHGTVDGEGIRVYASINTPTDVIGNTVYDNARTGIFFLCADTAGGSGSRILHNICYGNGFDGLRVTSSNVGTYIPADCMIMNNSCYDNGAVTTTGNGAGIYCIGALRPSIYRNSCYRNGILADEGYGIAVLNSSAGIATGNVCYDNYVHAMEINCSGTYNSNNWIIRGNHLYGVTGTLYALKLDYTGTGCIIEGNVINTGPYGGIYLGIHNDNDVDIRYNTFIGEGVNAHCIRLNDMGAYAGAGHKIRYNNFTGTAQSCVMDEASSWTSGVTLTRNNYDTTGDNVIWNLGGAANDYTKDTVTSVDTTALVVSGVVDVNNYLVINTELKGVGTFVAGARGFDDLPLPLHPDIGAVQDRTAPGRRFGAGGGTL